MEPFELPAAIGEKRLQGQQILFPSPSSFLGSGLRMAPGVDLQKPNELHKAKTFPFSVRARVGKCSSLKRGDCGWQLGRSEEGMEWDGREGGWCPTCCLETAAIPDSLELCTWGGLGAKMTLLTKGEFVKALASGRSVLHSCHPCLPGLQEQMLLARPLSGVRLHSSADRDGTVPQCGGNWLRALLMERLSVCLMAFVFVFFQA